MRQVKVFAGNSHPILTAAICDRLGDVPSPCKVSKFANGEISVVIETSVRNQDIYIVQSGSKKMNDSVMELLIMISACKGGSAKSITAVLPYFPYCRSSKKKTHRGSITARMLANLLTVAGIDHVVTIDLHAPPMQGFFGKPVDNLTAEPIIARWIRTNVKDWQNAVIASKSAGGSKRVTAMADLLKLNFAIVTTDRRRHPNTGGNWLGSSMVLNKFIDLNLMNETPKPPLEQPAPEPSPEQSPEITPQPDAERPFGFMTPPSRPEKKLPTTTNTMTPTGRIEIPRSSPLSHSISAEQDTTQPSPRPRLHRSNTAPSPLPTPNVDFDEYTDGKAQEIVTGRFIGGHIRDDDFPSPMLSNMSGSVTNLRDEQIGHPALDDPMTQSFMSTMSSIHQVDSVSGTYDRAALSDEEEEDEKLRNPELEHTVTLVGRVNGKSVILLDDILDRPESWIAAAETIVKRGGATKVYCMATHGLFGGDSLEALEDCDCIDKIIVCDTFPIDSEAQRTSKKLIVLPIAGLLAEAIRRNQHGEALSEIYRYYQD